MIACNDYVQVKEVSTEGIQTPGDNLKIGEVISIGEKAATSYDQNHFKHEDFVYFKIGNKVLFDTNKSLKHGGLWYLKANSIFAYDAHN